MQMMTQCNLILALLAGLVFPELALATNFYVTTDGNDANSGTSLSAPWKTLAFAATSPLIQPGDTVFVQAGQYSANKKGQVQIISDRILLNLVRRAWCPGT